MLFIVVVYMAFKIIYSSYVINSLYYSIMFQEYTFRDVLLKSVFVLDQKEMVLNAIRRIEPDFQCINPDPPDTCYSCSLLQELNLNKVIVIFFYSCHHLTYFHIHKLWSIILTIISIFVIYLSFAFNHFFYI